MYTFFRSFRLSAAVALAAAARATACAQAVLFICDGFVWVIWALLHLDRKAKMEDVVNHTQCMRNNVSRHWIYVLYFVVLIQFDVYLIYFCCCLCMLSVLLSALPVEMLVLYSHSIVLFRTRAPTFIYALWHLVPFIKCCVCVDVHMRESQADIISNVHFCVNEYGCIHVKLLPFVQWNEVKHMYLCVRQGVGLY